MTNPILGVDPQSNEVSEVPESTEQPTTQVEAATQTSEETPRIKEPQLTPAQVYEMQEKARLYDTIQADPELNAHVLSHIERKLRPNQVPTQQPTVPQTAEATELQKLRQELAQQKEEFQKMMALQAIRDFKARTPDFDAHKEEMAALLQRHQTLTLDEAYQFARRAKESKGGPQDGQRKAAIQTSEVNNTPPVSSSEDADSDFDRIAKRINDPKATPRFDDVLDTAMRAALKKR